MKILVTGGAGYIGSVVSEKLLEKGFKLVVIDDLSKGHKIAVSDKAKFYECCTLNKNALEEVFKENPDIKGVMHFAANIEVGESVINPSKYFYNNVVGSLNTIDLTQRYGIKAFIFSSTAAVYGNPERIPIKETDKLAPINPYGESKLQTEKFFKYFHKAYGLSYCVLRYFNACGAYKHLGEGHNPESHLIPNVIRGVLGSNNGVKIFGTDYDTKDGTPVRDYIHVEDLADAHILALNAIFEGNIKNEYFNIGSKEGYTVFEIVKMVEKVSKQKVPYSIGSRRDGDATRLIADNTKIRDILGWQPKHDLESIIQTAWDWHSAHPEGYKE